MANHFRSVLAGAAARLQSKVVSALTSQQTVLPDNGYDGLSEVTVNPQSHSGTVTISSKYETGNGYDMGVNHSKRYVKTSGLMVTPTATKSITANGTGIDVLNYKKVDVAVPAVNNKKYTTPTSASPGTTVSVNCGFAAKYVIVGYYRSTGRSTGFAYNFNGNAGYRNTSTTGDVNNISVTVNLTSTGFNIVFGNESYGWDIVDTMFYLACP